MAANDASLVDAFFSEYIFGFMKHDLEVAIEAKANFLAALGLVTYSEFLGSLKLGTVTKETGNKEKFEAFLPLLGPAYEQLDKAIKADPNFPRGLYQVVRSGLVHEYFVKEDALIARHGEHIPSGIYRDPQTGKLVLVGKRFLDDFLAAAKTVQDEIREAPKPDTIVFMRRFVSFPSQPTFSSSGLTTGTAVGPGSSRP